MSGGVNLLSSVVLLMLFVRFLVQQVRLIEAPDWRQRKHERRHMILEGITFGDCSYVGR